MTDWNVGPGVKAAVDQDGGELRSDERFVILTEGDKVSMTMATSGVYYWFERDNVTQRTSF